MTDLAAIKDGSAVTLKFRDEAGATFEQEGTAEVSNEYGVLFREKGKQSAKLIAADGVISIEVAEGKPAKLRVKRFDLLTDPAKARQHLVAEHGYKVSDIEKMSEADAFAHHESVDHTDLGHQHRAPKAKAEAEQTSEDTTSAE